MRALAALILLTFAVLAILAGNRAKPLLVEAHVKAAPQAEGPAQLYDLCPIVTPRDPAAVHQT